MTNVFETIRWDMENVGRDLPAYKRPTGLRIVKEGFPRTRLGKIQRHLVLQRLQRSAAEAERPRRRSPADAELAAPEDEVGRRSWRTCGRRRRSRPSDWTTTWSWTSDWTPWRAWRCWSPWRALLDVKIPDEPPPSSSPCAR